MSAGWMRSAFARHALLENTQMPVEQALSLYAKHVVLANFHHLPHQHNVDSASVELFPQ
jgi:hypothetical protein